MYILYLFNVFWCIVFTCPVLNLHILVEFGKIRSNHQT